MSAKRAVRLLRRRLFGERNASEIDLVKAALRRHEAKVDAMSDEWARLRAPCCPGCMFGAEYSDAADKCERTRRWLIVLLQRRGLPDDLTRVRSLEMDCTPLPRPKERADDVR